MTRRALGKGLDALLPSTPATGTPLVELDIDSIRPNAYQPRAHFEPARLQELAASIAENGVLQPIVVRQAGEEFELIAGERRWRAAQQAGLRQLPAIIQNVSDEKMVELALVENIQRDELSPIEEAHAYQLLVEEFKLTQEEVARRVGKSRTAVTNTLRLLRLPRSIQSLLLESQLAMGHARALVPLSKKDQLVLARETVKKGLSVRDVERRAQRLINPPQKKVRPRDPNVRLAEEKLEEAWKTRVQILQRGGRGRIVLHFHSEDELDRLYQALLSRPD